MGGPPMGMPPMGMPRMPGPMGGPPLGGPMGGPPMGGPPMGGMPPMPPMSSPGPGPVPPAVLEQLNNLRSDQQKMLAAADEAEREGDEDAKEFKMMLAEEIGEKISELENEHKEALSAPS